MKQVCLEVPAPSRSLSRSSLPNSPASSLLGSEVPCVGLAVRLVNPFEPVPEKRVFSIELFLVPDFSSGVDSYRDLCVQGEPMVPFVLVTRIRVEGSCGHAEECPCCRARGVPAALDSNRRFLIPKVGQPCRRNLVCEMKSFSPFIPTTACSFVGPFRGPPVLGVGESVVPWRIWVSSVKLPELLQTAY